MPIDLDAVYRLAENLESYAELEGTELGEACCNLAQVSRYPDYLSEKFMKAVIKEMKKQLKNFEDNAEIKYETHNVTSSVKFLEWRNIYSGGLDDIDT